MQAKVCGLTTAEQVKTCVDYGANFCGFILNYSKSHRFIDYQKIKELTKVDRKNTSYVGVLVEPTKKELQTFSNLNLDYFQIYGDLSENEISEIKTEYKKKVIMAIQVKEKEDLLKYKNFENSADIILFDSSGLHKSLSWNYKWIKIIPPYINKMIAGNLNIDMLENLREIADIIDVSGALETNKVKDLNKIKLFLDKIKKINDKN